MKITTILPGITYYEDALKDADELFMRIMHQIQVEQGYLKFNGRTVAMPGLTAWYGDSNAIYNYSGLRNIPKPWTPALAELRDRINNRLGTKCNSVLANYYADGTRSIGWHADDERELTDRIVSVSLGDTRSFYLRKKHETALAAVVELKHGSILTMDIGSQSNYLHSVPKESDKNARLNLTYRTVMV